MTPLIDGVMLAASSSPAATMVAKATVAMELGLTGAWLARGSGWRLPSQGPTTRFRPSRRRAPALAIRPWFRDRQDSERRTPPTLAALDAAAAWLAASAPTLRLRF